MFKSLTFIFGIPLLLTSVLFNLFERVSSTYLFFGVWATLFLSVFSMVYGLRLLVKYFKPRQMYIGIDMAVACPGHEFKATCDCGRNQYCIHCGEGTGVILCDCPISIEDT